jgi:methylase of polypeptide subunit release factors
MVYEPAEDSYLLEKVVKNYIYDLDSKEISVLDMGTGSGIQALACINSGINKNHVLAADIDEDSVKILKTRGLKTIQTDLLSKIKSKERFDLIIFN